MKSDLIQTAIGGIDADLIEAADEKRSSVRRRRIFKRVGMIAACLAVIAVAVSIPGLLRPAPEAPDLTLKESKIETRPCEPDTQEYGSWCLLPGGIRPELMVNGKLYYWDRFAYPLSFSQSLGVYIDSTGTTALPAGFSSCGQLSSVTADTPTEEFQMRAGFSAMGEIFVNEAAPETVYVLLSADFFASGPNYIRFISEKLAEGDLISWKSQSFRFCLGHDVCEVIDRLPEGSELIGRLHFIGIDGLPEKDLETNSPNDNYGHALEGREVYRNPAEPDCVYVRETQYWIGGEYEAWVKCPRLP